ncbi:hypothetical protein C1645_829983 [Glomus cerebriforme]|uniref:Uncharacterized protein n=1 Tax=Glomus cerebriforme TaxID=658196 RepID=A0A397SPK6_9GLOM|nr:hypothetical protein C1645_829983 [Glomus cerebriforme]
MEKFRLYVTSHFCNVTDLTKKRLNILIASTTSLIKYLHTLCRSTSILPEVEETLEYENIEQDLVDENNSEYENYGECESLSNTEKDGSEFLFELDFNMLAGAKKFAQQHK